MFELIMTFCIGVSDCQKETVANFPQYDVGQKICEIAKPAIERDVRARVSPGTRVTFVCLPAVEGDETEYRYERPTPHESDLMQQLPGLLQQFRNYTR